jgi:hypothetical protein
MRDAERGSTRADGARRLENFYLVYGKRGGMEESLTFLVEEWAGASYGAAHSSLQ